MPQDPPVKKRDPFDALVDEQPKRDPFDALSDDASFQSSLRPAEYPLTSGAAGGGSMLSATGSAGSVAAPSPSPEPQGPPSLPAPDPQQERTRKRSEALQAWSNLLDVERQAKERHAQAMTKEVAYSDLGMRGKVGTQSDELRQAGNAILTTEAAKKKLGATFDSMLDEIAREEVDRDPSRFIKKGDLGQDEINAFAVRDAVDAIAKQYGLTTLNTYRDQGGLAVTSQTNEDIASTLRNRITNLAQANVYLPKVKAIVEPKINELTGKVWDKFTTDEVEFAKAKQVILSERSSVERAMEQEAELLNEQVAQKSAAIKAEWESYQSQLAQQAQQVNDLFQSGQINEQQANEQMASLNADQEARLAQVNGMLHQELALVNKNIANINRKYNGQFSARQDQIIAAAEANIKKSAEEYMQKFPSTPEGKAMALEARRIEKEAWEEVIKKDAQARDALAKTDEELGLGPSAIPSLLRQAYKSTTTSLGGSLKGWASALNSADLYALGDVMERAYLRVAPPSKEELASTSWTDKLKKSLQPVEFAKNTGELLGGMAISLAAGAAAGAATSGIGVAPALAASGTAAWGAETMDMAGRARDAMLKKTGDNEKADKAFWDTVDSQVDLSWTYALGGLPFVKGSLKFIPTKAGRVAAGALAEYGEEVLQEVPQNIAERNIAEGRDPWEGFLDELRASMQSGELSNTLVKMLPVAALGAGGQIMESGESTEKQAAKIAASLGTKSEIGRLISGSANEWAGRLAATNGERTAKAVISSMYTSGAIDDKQMLALNRAIEKYPKARKEASDLGVPSMYRGAYADLMMQHDDLMQQIEAEGSDIAKSALKARASEVKKAAIAIADGLPDYIQIKHPDGSINTLSVWDAERLFHDKRFLQATALAGMGVGGIHVSYMGVDAKALDALASFQERAAQELLRIKAEAATKRDSAASPPVSVEAPNVADDRKAIMAKTKEALRKMVADFQSQRATGQLGGSAVIESKEAPETQPKDEVDAILDEEFAEEPEAAVSGGLPEVPTGDPEATTAIETPQGTGVEVEVGPAGAVTPEATSATQSVVETPAEAPTGATTPPQPVAQKAKPGKKDVAQAATTPATEPVTSITEVAKSKDGSQVEYKVPGWEDLRIVVQREKGGYAANIMVGDQALKIQPKGKEEGTAKLAILDAKERLDRAGREKISALISSATPKEQRPANREEPKTPIGDTRTVVVDGKERTVFNSDGRPIHPTVEGVRNFWKWFAGSKVFDDQGRPLVLYHGTAKDFAFFAHQSRTNAFESGVIGFYFSPDPEVANIYSGFSRGSATVMPVYLMLRNPYVMDDAEHADLSTDRSRSIATRERLINEGYDGIIMDVGNEYVVFDPEQIKSATGNYGRFDPSNPSIVEQRPQDGIAASETAIDRIENVVKALRSIVPDLAVIVHDTPEEFAAESRRAGGRGIASDAAFYDPKTNAIHLNRQMASDNTLFHEAAHPILLAVLQNNPELFLSLYEQLAKDPAFDKYIKFGESYSDKDELTRAAESLAEFMADVAAGKVQFSKEPGSLWQKFVEWLQELMAKVGLDFRAIDLSNPQNVRDFASKFARGVREGIELKGLAEVRRSDALPMLQEDAQAVVDGWYSRLDQAVAAKGSTMPGSQWGKWLEARAKEGALSLEEAKWTGLSDWLAGKGNEKVTPQQVREFLKDNRVKVEVKQYGGDKNVSKPSMYRDGEKWVVKGGSDVDRYYISMDDAIADHRARIREIEEADQTEFSKYQLPGASNYREVLVTLPKKETRKKGIVRKVGDGPYPWKVFTGDAADGNHASSHRTEEEAMEAAKMDFSTTEKEKFRSTHFDEPNILVHLRLNDRTGPNGEKILFIEELQSDWGQQGKKKGFARQLPSGWTATKSRDIGGNQTWIVKNAAGDRVGGGGAVWQADTAEDAIADAARIKTPKEGTPSAPFVTSTDAWVELGLKQAIRMAAQGGYDKIAWSTGEQQFNRWGSQAFAWSKGKTGWRIIGKEQIGGEAFAGMEEALAQEAKESDTIITSKEELRDVVEGVMGRERSDYSTEKWKTHINKIVDGMWERMQNEDSGTTMPRREGMKGFYDKILPTVAKKVSKRLGGDGVVEDIGISTGTNEMEVIDHFDDVSEDVLNKERDKARALDITQQQSIAITPEMRQRVSMGVPLMQRPKAIPVDRWNAMVPTIREALKAGMKPKEVMSVLRERKLLKGVGGVQIATLHAQIKSAYGKIAAIKSGRNRKDPNDPWRIRAEGIDENVVVDKRITEDDSKKLAEAEKLRRSIKKGLKKGAQKRRDVYLNELAKDFTSLRIPKTALDDYISMATAIRDLIRGASVAVGKRSVDALRTDAGVTNEQIEQYIQQQQQAQQPLDEQEMLEEFERKRIEMGLEGASLTLDDIRSLMNSFAAEEQQQKALEAKMKAEQKLQMLRTMSRLKLEELSEHLKSQELDKEKKQIVANLKLIDLDRLSAKDAVFLIGMVNNIVKNDRWGGARTFSEEVGSSERAIALMQEFAAMRKKLPKPKAARNATEQVVMMMRRFFGEYSDKIAEASGMDGILNASAQANRVAEEIHKARDKYAKSVGYKDTELNRYRAQAYAYLQSVEGDTQEQQQASFEKLRNDLLESARMLMDPTRDTHRVKFPDLYIQAVAEVAEPARSLGDVKVAEPIRKMVEWEQQQHAKDYAMHAQAAELDHNKRMGYVRAYTARGYFETDRFTETQQNRDPSVLERFFDGTTVKERLAGSKMDRVGRRPSQIVDLDFFSVQDSARRELYMDTFGARYIARMRGVLTDPRLFEGDNPVMTRATRDIMTQRVRSLIKADQVVADVFSDKWTKAYNKVSRRASAIALVGSGAFIKQLTPLVSTFFHVRPSELVQGMRDATQTHREGTWQNNIAKTQTIYERAQVMAGLERIGETVARKAVLRGDENRAMELSKLLYTEAGHLSNELGRRTIALGDAWAATATWWAFYRQYIRKAGLENTNWKAELNEQAAAYASDREQFMQGANIPEANAPMYRNVKLFQRVVLDIFFSFNSFNLNNLNRMSHDIKDIRFGSPEARKRGYIDLAARLFEMAAFRATADALRIHVTLFLADLILEAIGDDPEDDRARRAAADAKKYDYWVRLLADVGMDFVFTGMGDIPINVVKDGFNTIVNLAERDTGPEKRNYDLYYVSDKDSYGVLGILYGQASNLAKAAEVMSMYKGVEGKEAKRMRDEAMILAALSVAHLAGYTDQTITRGLEREIVRRLPYQVMHKREERFGQVLGKALYDLIDQDEPYTPSDTYYDLIDQDEPYTPSDTYEND